MQDADFTLPTLDPRGLARRAALPLAAAGGVAAVLLVAGGPLDAFRDAVGRALDADPRWVAAAVAFELLSFAGYVALLWLVGGRATDRLGLRESAEVTLGGAAATRLLPTAGVGGAALTLWAFRKTGLSTAAAGRTLLAFLVLLYSVFLGSVLVAGAALALTGTGPLVLTALPAALAGLAIVLGLASRKLSGRRAVVLAGGVRDALGHLRTADARLVGAPVWWGFDLAVLYAMLHAFGTAPAFGIVVVAYFVGQVGNTLPIPGAVSGGLTGVLLGFGVAADLAIVSVLAYRAVAIWIPAPVGLVALAALRRTVARWSEADSGALAAEAPPRPAAPRPLAGRPVIARPPRAASPRPVATAPAPPCHGPVLA